MRRLLPLALLFTATVSTAVVVGLLYGPESLDDGAPDLAPDLAPTRSVTVPRDYSGFFIAKVHVGAYHVDMVVDTGALLVALTTQDARRLNLHPEGLIDDIEVITASGRTRGSLVRLEEIAVGGVAVRDVEAVILGAGLERSLLGMSFLGRLSEVELTRDQITLRR